MGQYSQYLEASQGIKTSIENDPRLDEIMGNLFRSRPLFEGSMHHVIRAGNIGGSDVVVRTFKPRVPRAYMLRPRVPKDYMLADLEYCARKYAEHYGGRVRVPSFAIGAFIGAFPFLFTEDLTEDGRYYIDDVSGGHGSMLRPGGIEVLFDFGLDDLGIDERKEIKAEMLRQPLFFALEHSLTIR